VIALEEHYLDPEVARHFTGMDAVPSRGSGGAAGLPMVARRLYDLDELRLKEMDEAGMDIQVLSHAAPSLQKFDAETAVRLAQGVNDRLAATVKAHPDRFAAFAAIPTPDPKAAADELERAVTKLGFKGAMIHGLTNGLFIDDPRFWPIFERAAALDTPLYMHPSIPDPRVIDVYYKDYVEKFPTILRAAWGFTVETATQGVRLVLSGVFEKYPGLKIILGHLGEGLPLYLWRINMGFARDGRGPPGSAMPSPSISGSPPAASSPTRLCCIASRRSASTASCSRSTTRLSTTRPAPPGPNACRYPPPTRRRSSAAMRSGC
jgi:2,3-dihydroxybenzoate decarboxylase